MKDISLDIEVEGVKYTLAFTLNVMQAIQENPKYGSVQAWGEKVEANVDGMDAAAVIFGFGEMLNEGIDIANEAKPAEEQKPLLTTRQVGRIITKMGITNAAQTINDLVVKSTTDPNPKNA